MTFIRILLSYSLLFLLVALLAAAWVYRDTLEPELKAAWSRIETRLAGAEPKETTEEMAPQVATPTPSAVEPVPEAIEPPATVASEESPAGIPAPQTPTLPAASREEASVIESSETPMAEAPATAEPVPQAVTEAPPAAAGTETSTPATAPREAAPAETAIAQKENETETPSPSASVLAEPASPAVSAPETPPASASTEEAELLDRARRAYWAGDLPAAVAAYQALLEKDPAEADAWGELGNVYYAMGRWQEAGQAYYEAASRLIARGDTRQLGYLLRIIDSLAPEKAAELRARLAQPAAGS